MYMSHVQSVNLNTYTYHMEALFIPNAFTFETVCTCKRLILAISLHFKEYYYMYMYI